ncbi:cyclic AMP-dependent transcription factor ATF-6 beta-like isoform X1 [Mizuhopecten yessoensis]|uniref:cyclic AMP-dependent transcription factor ATF-6 beta-like isoform X1 n=1 Tax=Mizuhopecten yessoensis TaxID=6573 RepID=UPI000B45D049|nr:cyclic AMP-dependent transcription factor ATF-6 beta-like isoform X1 [Mizuhopecten yessoensis]
MSLNMVSEVDRRFYSNNLLSNEDLESDMDLSEILGMDAALNPEDLVRNFPDDFPTLTLDAINNDTFAVFPDSVNIFSDDLQQEFSDSSDSGISGVTVQYENQPSPDLLIKQEPPSPASSLSSEGSDGTVSQSHKTYTADFDLKIESPPLSPQSMILSGQGHNITQASFTYINDQSELGSQVIINAPTQPCSTVLTGFDTSININSILNSKVKIQPKPLSTDKTTTVQKPAFPNTEPGKPLVLTPEEFKRLTSQGVLKFQPPCTNQKNKAEIPKVTTTVISPPQIKMAGSPIVQVDHEMKNVKRQQRMIKNRESASLSRKRKKEYLQTLEEQLSDYDQQNQKLQQENEELRRRLSTMQTENEVLKRRGTGMASPTKKICLMAVFVLFSLNLGTFSDLIFTPHITRRNSNPSPDMFPHKGRQLLAVTEEKDTYSVGSFMPDYPFSRLKKFMEENPQHAKEINNDTLYQLYTCPSYFNKTESIRLADQLSGWMKRHEQQKKKKPRKPANKGRRPITSSHSLRELRHLREEQYRSRENQLQLFQNDTVRNFWQSLPRRNDTFYVLSFNSDYFLIPAVAHNKTMRPRMSLVMPATSLNETMQPPAGNIGMMQIDCEVLNTQLIHVHKSALPRHNTSESFFP